MSPYLLQDSGKYSLYVKNQYGADETSINLSVLEKPSAPRGPLRVSNITANRYHHYQNFGVLCCFVFFSISDLK